jgi:DnaJ family protein C protein 2
LLDPARRRKYDSSLPFNDSIPNESDNINEYNFYEVFDLVFKRNAKFAKKKPVPVIGDSTYPI